MEDKREEYGKDYKQSYGRRPLWQWVLIYLVIAAVLYGLIYYFFLGPRGYQLPGTRSLSPTNQPSVPQSFY